MEVDLKDNIRMIKHKEKAKNSIKMEGSMLDNIKMG